MRGGVFLLQAPAERAEGFPECCGVGGWIEEMGGWGMNFMVSCFPR